MQTLRKEIWALLFLAAVVVGVSYQGMADPRLEGLDGAHHVMDGVFFYDFLSDMPFDRLAKYPFDYYKQYPALGFVFWPPFFPFVEGVVFHVLGIGLLSAHVCLALFSTVFLVTFYLLMRRDLSQGYAILGASLLASAPILYPFFNTIMREIPVLAMMTLTLYAYFKTVSNDSTASSYWRWQLVVFFALLTLYTKQTGFVIFFGMIADIFVNRRGLLRRPQLWVAVASFCFFVFPLVVFTFVYGKSNLEQSIGDNTKLIMQNYSGPSRWTVDSWIFYLKSFYSGTNILVVVLFVGALFKTIVDPSFFKKHIVYFAWLIAFYLLFSYFDNKSDRFFTLAVVPVIAICTLYVSSLLQYWKGVWKFAAVLVILSVDLIGFYPTFNKKLVGIDGIESILDGMDLDIYEGNVAYIGTYRQPFVYYLRVKDVERSRFILQGDDVFSARDSADTIRDFRIRFILVEPDSLSKASESVVRNLESNPEVTEVLRAHFQVGRLSIPLILYRFEGDLPHTMKEVTLSSKLIGS